MNYEEAIDYIHSIPKFIRPLGNEKLGGLLRELGNPQTGGKYIHIAGTNGKGSVAAMLSSVFTEAGYKTGLFTSPFIEVFNERIRINNVNIPDGELARLTERVKSAMDKSGSYVSEFAFITAMAFLYFNEQNCDYVILETGMGGRYDATNIIDRPLVSVLTAIGYDHTQYLGDTIEEIAAEKCGIIKEGGVTVSQPNTAVRGVIEAAAFEKHSELIFCENSVKTGDGFKYKGVEYELSLDGDYQAANAACAVETVAALRRLGVKITDEALKNGLKTAKWQVRFERVRDNIIIDGAHNIDGIRALKKSLAALKREYVIVIAMMSDKAVGECVREIADGAAAVIATEIPMPRCEKARTLATYADGAVCEPDYKTAIDKAVSAAGNDKLVCICGSLYFAAEAKKYMKNTKISRKIIK